MKRIGVLLVKELTQIRRDRSLFGILIMAPLVQLVIMGYAVTTDIRNIRLSVRDRDHSWHSREYARAISASGYFRMRYVVGPDREDADALVWGKAGLALDIPAGFGRELSAGRPAAVQVLVDGGDSNFAVQGLNYLQKANRLFSERLVRPIQNDLARRGAPGWPAVVVESRAWYNAGLTSRYFTIPGLMGILLMVTTMIVTSMSLVKEREEGTMEQLIVTPLRPSALIAGKLLPFVVIGLLELTLALGVLRVLFDVPYRGRIVDLYLLSGLFLLTTLGLGLAVSTLVRTQQQAMLVASFFVMMPFILLSGFVFPVENMPAPIRWVTHLIPLKYLMTAVRGLFLKGCGWADLWRDAAVLAVWGVGILAVAVLKFRKRLD